MAADRVEGGVPVPTDEERAKRYAAGLYSEVPMQDPRAMIRTCGSVLGGVAWSRRTFPGMI